MGTALLRPHRRRAGPLRGRGLAALALTLLGAPLGAQELLHPDQLDLKGLEHRIGQLQETLVQLEGDELREALDELVLIEHDARELLPLQTGTSLGRAHSVLYKTLAERGRFEVDESAEQRLAWFTEAIEHADGDGRPNVRARARVLKVNLLMIERRLDEARELAEWALAEIPDANVQRPYLFHALAEIELQSGDYARALESLAELDRLPTWERLAEAGWTTDPWASLRRHVPGTRGQVYLEMGLPDRARPHIEEEMRLTEPLRAHELKFRKDIIAAHIHEANLLLAIGLDERAVERVEGFLADAPLYEGLPHWRGVLLRVRAAALARLERDDPSRERLAEGVAREAIECGLPERETLKAEVLLAELALRRDSIAEAEALLERARWRLENWRAGMERGAPVHEEATLATLEARLALARGASVEELIERLEALLTAFEGRLALWSSAPLRPGGLGFLQLPARRAWLSELTRLHLAVAGEERGARDALDTLMRAQAQGSIVRRAGGVEGALDDVCREVLVGGHGLLVYLPAPERSHLFVVDAAGARHVELEPEWRLEELRREYVFAAMARREGASRARDDSRERSVARELAEELLPPVIAERVAGWAGLTVVGVDLLGRVPFEALPFGGGWLGVELAVDYLPSLPLGLLLGRRTPIVDTELDLLLVAAPSVSTELRELLPGGGDLQLSAADERALTAAYASDRVRLLVGDRARPDLARELLPSARVTQFLAHAIQEVERERPTVLVLSPGETGDGRLTCLDVDGLTASPMVILSACRTGRGPLRRGDEGTGHMGGAWLGAGARVVLLADTDLDYRPTVQLTSWVHERMVRFGDSPAEAARSARARLVAEGGLATPFDAGIVRVLGLGHVPLFPRPADPAASGTAASGNAVSGSAASSTEAAAPDARDGELPDSPSRKRLDPLLLGAALLGGLALVLAIVARRLRRAAGE